MDIRYRAKPMLVLYAASDPSLYIDLVIAAAAIGSILGEMPGIGSGTASLAAVLRYGRHLGLSEPRLKVGQYLFRKHGGKVVFFGIFVGLVADLGSVPSGREPLILARQCRGGDFVGGRFRCWRLLPR
jgi:membrane protein DedA with SNARE-associated domain